MEDFGMNEKPRILIFTGDGKGKTTAAIGMAFRASGHGMRSCMIQFMKSDTTVGEIAAAAASTNIEIHPTGLGFVPKGGPRLEEHRAAAQAGLKKAAEIIAARQFGLVILDEICGAIGCGLIDERQVTDLLTTAPPDVCLVLTGRGAGAALIVLADTVTEMLCIKHGMYEGYEAQKGIER
jgi:cob(I)alamin adenosyltransferase